MSNPGRGRSAFVAAFLASTIASAIVVTSSAFGVAQTIFAFDDSFTATTYTMDQGDRPALQNTGVNQHNVTARTNGPDGNPLFASLTISTGASSAAGTEYLTTGSYAFFCTTHPLSMQAELQVSGLGIPLARPKIDVVISGSSLATAAKKGKLPVKVQALTTSNGVELAAKLGKGVIGTQKPFNLAAGQTRQLTLKIGKSGKKKLAGRNSAKVTVTGTVPFGAPDTGKKTLK